MTAHYYSISPRIAWLEALDGGRAERTVWLADVDAADVRQLDGTGWLVWILLSEGATTVEQLHAAAAADGVDDAFESFDLGGFLDDLVTSGVLTRDDGEGPTR